MRHFKHVKILSVLKYYNCGHLRFCILPQLGLIFYKKILQLTVLPVMSLTGRFDFWNVCSKLYFINGIFSNYLYSYEHPILLNNVTLALLLIAMVVYIHFI